MMRSIQYAAFAQMLKLNSNDGEKEKSRKSTLENIFIEKS